MSSTDGGRALSDVLSEVIDLVGDVKQARRKVPGADVLHPELDQLLEDLVRWDHHLIEEEEAEGFSPLATMPSVAGRTPANLWTGTPSDDDVRRVLGEHLERLEQHVASAMDAQGGSSRAVLAEVRQGLQAHLLALGRG